jgi:hypothetical protein
MVESFIIQIYRRDDARRGLTGTVERVKDGSKQSFANVDELWRCLSTEPSSRRGRGPPTAGGTSSAD